jgi:hypothetical protein
MGSGYLLGNDISNNRHDGVNSELAYIILENNIIASNSGFGVRGDHSIVNASGNLIYDNARWGLYSSGGRIINENNVFEKDGKGNKEGNLLQEWEILVEVLDENYDPIEDVNLTIKNSYGDLIWSGQTISSVRRFVLREYEINSEGNELRHSPFTIRAIKDDAENTSVENINTNQKVIIFLESDEEPSKESIKLWFIWLSLLVVIIMILAAIIQVYRNKK